jgi:hypothetical protein
MHDKNGYDMLAKAEESMNNNKQEIYKIYLPI